MHNVYVHVDGAGSDKHRAQATCITIHFLSFPFVLFFPCFVLFSGPSLSCERDRAELFAPGLRQLLAADDAEKEKNTQKTPVCAV
jgi:hypothetical protein